jgi:two-component system chemotaxis response regulator CheY
MPEMDGIETLRKIKEIDSKAKVVMVTAMGQDKLVREAVKLGATSFLVKPFNENQLIQTFKQVSSRK